MLEQTHALARLTQQDVSLARDAAKALALMQRPLRTEQTIRCSAKELADIVWDNPILLWEERINAATMADTVLLNGVQRRLAEADWADGFRMTYHVLWPDRKVHQILLWPRFYKAARQRLTNMLDYRSGVGEVMKDRIWKAILEDRNEKGN